MKKIIGFDLCGQISLDFISGVVIFMFSFMFLFQTLTCLFVPFQTNSDEIKSKKSSIDLCADFGGPDRGFLESLWVQDGKVGFNRRMPVTPFSNYKLLEKSQGPRGKWG